MQILITYHYSYYIHTTNLHNIMKYKLYMTALPINMEYDLYCLLIYCIKWISSIYGNYEFNIIVIYICVFFTIKMLHLIIYINYLNILSTIFM